MAVPRSLNLPLERRRVIVSVSSLIVLAACGGQDATTVAVVEPLLPGEGEPAEAPSTGESEPAPPPATSTESSSDASSLYVISSFVFGPDGTTTYVALTSSLEAQTIDYAAAREFPGSSDLWVWGGEVFIANAESTTITKFAVLDGALVERATLSFAAYGLTNFGFWLNTFVSPTKAYFLNGAAEYIVWNPATMELGGTLALPELEPRPGLRPFTAYSDRSAVLRDGLLYQPLYWTDDTYFEFAPDSRIVVTDVASDRVVDVLDAPCPGLDYATVGEDGALYFSSWVYAAGGALLLDQPATCVFQVPTQGSPSVAFPFGAVTEGRQGAALRHVTGGRGLMSVLHGERAAAGVAADEFTFADNWRFWSYDFSTGQAAPIESIGWNAGAEYSFDIDGRTLMLVAAADYSATTVYDVGADLNPTPLFDAQGWAVRLFEIE